MVLIPGTKRRSYLEESVAASDGRVDDADLARAFLPGISASERYPAGQMKRSGLVSIAATGRTPPRRRDLAVCPP